MKRIRWTGWVLASILLLQNAATGLTAPSGTNPLEGHMLQRSDGSSYVYHDGLKFAVQMANVGDAVIDVIPQASSGQWTALFSGTATDAPIHAPLPEICYWCAS
jgi:hypothetical protein